MERDGLSETESHLVEAAARRAAAHFAWYRPESPVSCLQESDLATTYYAATETPASGDALYVTSGTSTGEPKKVIWPAADHALYVEQRGRLLDGFANGECGTACADLGTGHAASSAMEVFEHAGLRGSEIDFRWHVDRHVETLRRNQPDLLFTMPMILERVVAAGGPGYVPRRIVVVGDLAPRQWRSAMAERIGMPASDIMDVFGSIEVGAIAYSDEGTGAYLFHDHIIPEEIDGLLAVTSLTRSGFPAVRYVSGDRVAGLGRYDTADGVRWGYDHHLGREGNELKHGEMLSLHLVAVAMAEAAPGVAWDVRRRGLEVVIGVDRNAFSPAQADAIRAAIRAAHPDVDQMIRSGLVVDIDVEPVPMDKLGPKRTLNA